MNNELRNRMRKTKRPEKSLDSKVADFFSEDEKLKKYSGNNLNNENEAVFFIKKSAISIKKTLLKIINKIQSLDYKKFFKGLNVTLKKKKARRFIAAIAGVGVVFFGVQFMLSASQGEGDSIPQVQGADTNSEEPVEPDFQVATIDNSLNPTEVVYDQERRVASFGVTLDEQTDAIISQQEISPADATRENFLLSVAQSFDINREVQTAKGPLFIGSNQKQRAITAVFQEGVYLVFIRTNNLIDENKVVELVEELQL